MADETVNIVFNAVNNSDVALNSLKLQMAALSTEAAKLTGEVQKTPTAMDKATAAINGFRGAMFTLNQIIGVAQQVWRTAQQIVNATIGEYVKYAEQVRNLSQLTAQSAESTSRLIQVTEDYKLGVSDLTTASKRLATEGLSMNVETIAKLSDEFIKLHTGSERQLFLTEHLGRASVEWTNILMQGSEAILARNAAVNKSLILDAQALKKAEDYRLALDELSDSAMALKISMGEVLLPVLISIVDYLNRSILGWGEFFKFVNYLETQKYGTRMREDIDYTIDQGLQLQLTWEKDQAALEELAAQSLITGRAWEEMYTGLKNGIDRSAASFDWMGEQMKAFSEDGATVWDAFLRSSGHISEPAIKEFMRITAVFEQVKKWLASGMTTAIIVNYLNYQLGASKGGTVEPVAWTVPSGYTEIGTVGGAGTDRVFKNEEGNIITHKARGGYVPGRYAITGDSMSGHRTGYEELVDFQQKRVYSAPQTRAMGAVKGYAAGSGEIELSQRSIDKIADAIMYGVAKLQ